MENSEQYLNYNDYLMMGGTIDIVPFNLLELEARINIDRETRRRLKGLVEIPNEVKLCMFNLIQGLGLDANYKDANSDERIKYITRTIYNGLCGVVVNGEHILYRG